MKIWSNDIITPFLDFLHSDAMWFLFLILYFIIKFQIWLNLYNLRNASGTIQIQISIL